MRKFRISESQARALKMMNEAFNQGAGVAVAAKTDSNGKVTQQTLTQQDRELTSQGLQNAKIEVDQDNLHEDTGAGYGLNANEVAEALVYKFGADVVKGASGDKLKGMVKQVLASSFGTNPEDIGEEGITSLASEVEEAIPETLSDFDDAYMNEFFENVNPEQVASDIVSKYGIEVIEDASAEEVMAMMAEVLTDEWNIGSEDMDSSELAGLAAQVIKALNGMTAEGLNEGVKEIMNTAGQIYNARSLTNDRLRNLSRDKDPEKVDRVYKKVDKYIDKRIGDEKDPAKKKKMMFAKANADNNSSMNIMESGYVFTKKQLKEARLNKLVTEAKRTISKKDFKNA